MINILKRILLLGVLSLSLGTVCAEKVYAGEEIAGTLRATYLSGGSFQTVRGGGYTIGTPVLTQPLIFGISMALAVPITFDTPFSNIPAVVAGYESNVLTLIGASSPYYGHAVDNPDFAVNQITGLSISDITPEGCTLHVGLFINGTPTFPDVQRAIVQFAEYGFAINFIAKDTDPLPVA
jgi:hypothetical protein